MKVRGLLIVTVMAGSLWVIHNANRNMMPTQSRQLKRGPRNEKLARLRAAIH